MKLQDYISEMNKKSTVKTQRVMDLKRYYLSMYRVFMVKLYDSNFISDPTLFNEKEFFGNISSMKLSGMYDYTGNIRLTYKQSYFASKLVKDEEEKLFLYLLSNALKYRELSKDIDKLYDENQLNDLQRHNVSFGLRSKGAMVVSKTSCGISESICNCFLNSDEYCEEINFNSKIWEYALDVLGIPECERKEDGLFVKGMSNKDEIEFCDLIFEGSTRLDGKYSSLLENWLIDHKWETRGMTNNCKGLFEFVFSDRFHELMRFQVELLSNRKDVICIYKNYMYIKKKVSEYYIPIGCFTVSSDEEDILLFEGNSLCGYTGEAYPLEYLDSNDITYIGCPIELYVNNKDKRLFYDLEQVDTKQETWFKCNNVDFVFCEEEDLPEIKGNISKDSLEDKLANIYLNALRGNLVGKLKNIDGLEQARKNLMKYLK